MPFALDTIRRLWRRLVGDSYIPEGTVPPDTTECRTAVHEAGHVVTSWFCTGVERIDKATIVPASGTEGVVVYQYRECNLVSERSTPKAAWCKAVISMSGLAAEMAIYGKFRSGPAGGDLARVRELISIIGKEPPPWSDGPVYPSLPFDRMFVRSLSDLEKRVMDETYRAARRITAERRSEHGRLVSALLAERTIDNDAIERVLGSRLPVQFARLAGDRFLV